MADAYARALAKVVIAQTAESLGFDGVQQSAGDALAELMLQYVSELGSLTHGYAELAGRPDCNINDVLLAFKDMGIDLKEIMEYAGSTEDAPFAHTIPEFPVAKHGPAFQSFAHKGQDPPAHIPAFLPAFPDVHTYKDTPAFRTGTKDAREQKLAVGRAKKAAETAVVRLAQRTRRERDAGEAAEGTALLTTHSNPFLAPPIMETKAPMTEGVTSMDTDSILEARRMPTDSWHEADGTDRAAPGSTLLPAPLNLDWTMPSGPTMPRTLADMGFEDAFAGAGDDAAEKGGRQRRPSLKAKAAGDPASLRAEQILAAGADAMALGEAGEKEKEKEKAK